MAYQELLVQRTVAVGRRAAWLVNERQWSTCKHLPKNNTAGVFSRPIPSHQYVRDFASHVSVRRVLADDRMDCLANVDSVPANGGISALPRLSLWR